MTDLLLPPDQEKAIQLLIAGKSNRETAKAVGVSEGTLYRWFKLPAFATVLRQQQAHLRELSLSRVHSLLDLAFETLRDILKDKDPKNTFFRLEAAKKVFSLVDVHERAAIMEELEALKAQWLSLGQQSVEN